MTTCCTSWRRVVSGDAHGAGPSLARAGLRVLSVPYGWAASLRDVVRNGDAVGVGVPVLSVGNLTAGGTGKTPVVAHLVADLKRRGRRPVLLSRGYASQDGAPNDEAKLLSKLHPDVIHLQGRDRLALARYAADAKLGDVIVLDDGFQVFDLARSLNVCCIDATNPFGWGAVLPRGLLREPLSALYRARPVLITRAEQSTPERIARIRDEVLRWNEHARFVVSEMRAVALTDAAGADRSEPSALKDLRVLCASGIGNPDAFAANVRMTGARVAAHAEFPDHHAWTQADVKAVVARAREVAAEAVVTTTKDAVKLAELAWPSDAPPLRVMHIDVAITGNAEGWSAMIDEALARA